MNLADVRAFLEDIIDPRHFAPPTVKANAKDCIASIDELEDRMTAYIVEHGNRGSLWAAALRDDLLGDVPRVTKAERAEAQRVREVIAEDNSPR